MMEDLQQAYTAYQQALYHLKDPQVRLATISRGRHSPNLRTPGT